VRTLAYKKAEEVNGYIYGDKENGGTPTLYISAVPFEKIDAAIKADKANKKDISPGRPGMPVNVENYLSTGKGMFLSSIMTTFAGAAVAGITAYRTMKGDKAIRSQKNQNEQREEHNDDEGIK